MTFGWGCKRVIGVLGRGKLRLRDISKQNRSGMCVFLEVARVLVYKTEQ